MASFVEGRRYQRPTHEVVLGIKNTEKLLEVKMGDYLEFICPDFGGLSVYQVDKDQYQNCQLSAETQSEMKIWECSAEFNGRMTLKIQSYSASLNGFKFNPNTDYFFLARPADAYDCSDHHKIKMTVKEGDVTRRNHHEKKTEIKLEPSKDPPVTQQSSQTSKTTPTTPPMTKKEVTTKSVKYTLPDPSPSQTAKSIHTPEHQKMIGSSTINFTSNSVLLLSSLFILRMII